MTLSIAIIAKNEEESIAKCLESIKDADEIVFVDTGSEDKTIEIAKRYTDKIYYYKWNDNFAEARNHAISKCTGDWVLNIDADNKLLNTIDDVKQATLRAGEIRALNVNLECRGNLHYLPLLHKRCPDIKWNGAVHNHLSEVARTNSGLRIEYWHSPSHQKDPDRALRMLKNEVAKGGKVRELYYLAREYWYRKNYKRAIHWWKRYLKKSTFLSERADAHLFLARCYWALGQGETARQNCLQCLNINSNFKEALNFMAELSWEHNAKSWRKYAELATNEGVLFIRQ